VFFSNDIESKLVRLDHVESRHCLKVLRLGINDIIQVTDGKGNLYEAAINEISSGLVTGQIIKTSESPATHGFRLHIAMAPTKNSDRFEWFLEKSSEIGIDEITPVICTHSERNRINLERSRKILITAIKQSLKTWLPQLNEPLALTDFIDKSGKGIKLIASCLSGMEKEIQYSYTKGKDVIVLIGPEGDFSEPELKAAVKAGFIPVSLGESRLRTETAGVYVTAVINLLNRF